jgi:mevalonate kinase
MTIWKISNLDRNTADGFVNTVHWTASQTDGDFTASTYSTVSFTKSEDVNLIPFETLTEDMLIGWIKASLGEEGVAAVEATLAQQIELQKHPVMASGVPWSKN